MSRGSIVFLLIALASVPPAVAVDTLQVALPDPFLEPWRWTTFDRSSGLAGPVRDIFEDRDGNIWFATDNGVQRYDGIGWTTYTTRDGLAHNWVRTAIQTRDGAMWFGTDGGGISRFDGETWTTYTTAEGLANDSILRRGLLQTREGVLWAGFFNPHDTTGVRDGISRFDGEAWTTVQVPVGPSRPSIFDIHEASDGSLWFSAYRHGVLRFDGTEWTLYTAADGLASNRVVEIMESDDGSIWFACWEDGISRFDGRGWRTYTAREGLPEGLIFRSLWRTADGTVWAGSMNGTVCRFNGENWAAYPPESGRRSQNGFHALQARDGSVWMHGWGSESAFRFDYLSTKWAPYIHGDRFLGGCVTADGSVWFGTRQGAVRYDGTTWLRYTPEDGLLDAPIYGMAQTDNGCVWFLGGEPEKFEGVSRYHNGRWRRYSKEEIGIDGAYESGSTLRASDGSFWMIGSRNGASAAARYDRQTWRVYTREDGLAGSFLSHIFQTDNDDLWFGTRPPFKGDSQVGYGLLRYDGRGQWTSYTTEDGLSHNRIYGLFQAPDGKIWVGTRIGLSWFDGAEWHSYTKADGLPAEKPSGFVASNRDLWFRYSVEFSVGVTRYDGKGWKTYTTLDGLADNRVRTIYRAADGALWFGTDGGGVSRFDGVHWSSYTTDDGLVGNNIAWIVQSPDGAFWFRTYPDGKVGAFLPDRTGPETAIESALEEVSPQGNIFLRWSGRDMWDDTPPRELRYQWRIDGGDWSPVVERTDRTFTSLPGGRHTFEVRAIDRDGNIDPDPAVQIFTVLSPVWQQPWFIGMVLAFVGIIGVQTFRVFVAKQKLLEEAEKELRTAHQMQMGLMPTVAPKIEGFDIAGRCIPANHVGGDYFQYFEQGDTLLLALADVTGHAMEAAIPVVMFSGILDSQMELGGTVVDLFDRLNRSLCRNLDSPTFVCFTMGELDLTTRSFRMSNGGCPYPYHFRASAGEVIELQVDTYPLGVRPDTEYEEIEIRLQPGDRIVFCSDGIIEAENTAGGQFGYDRTLETVRKACEEGLSAEATIDRILEVVAAFRDDAPQSDDMTCMAVQVEGGQGGTGV